MPLSSVVGAQSIVKPGVCTSSTRPASPYDGQVIYETDTDKTLVYNGTGWVYLSTSRANPVGLDLIKTETSFTAQTTVTADSVFTSTYSNYLMTFSFTQSNTAATPYIQFRTSGSTNSTSNYGFQNSYITTALTASRTASGATSITLVPNIGADGCFGSLVIYDPQVSAKTKITMSATNTDANLPEFATGGFQSTTQFDGILLGISAGTFTGTYTIYGYAK